MLKKALATVAVALGGVMCAHASVPPAAAPEIDPGSAMAALTLLGGGLAVLRGRIRRK